MNFCMIISGIHKFTLTSFLLLTIYLEIILLAGRKFLIQRKIVDKSKNKFLKFIFGDNNNPYNNHVLIVIKFNLIILFISCIFGYQNEIIGQKHLI
jgi:hypothetical protein